MPNLDPKQSNRRERPTPPERNPKGDGRRPEPTGPKSNALWYLVVGGLILFITLSVVSNNKRGEKIKDAGREKRYAHYFHSTRIQIFTGIFEQGCLFLMRLIICQHRQRG